MPSSRFLTVSGPTQNQDAILALKICDPAMGSGAFLIEAMRLLARLLCEAWTRRDATPRIPGDETPLLFACRLIAQRCLYGVDKNRMAVDLAKLSFWLATLAQDHAFTFLDHNFRHGDSLVGLSLAQIEACHWSPDAQQSFVSQSLRPRLTVAMQKRMEIMTAGDLTSYEKLSDLRAEAETPLEFLRFLGDAVLGAFFEGGTATARERRRNDLSHTIRDYLDDKIDMPTRLALRGEIEQSVQVFPSAGAVLARVSLGDRIPRGVPGDVARRFDPPPGDGRIRCHGRQPAVRRQEHDRGGASGRLPRLAQDGASASRTAMPTSWPTFSGGRST